MPLQLLQVFAAHSSPALEFSLVHCQKYLLPTVNPASLKEEGAVRILNQKTVFRSSSP